MMLPDRQPLLALLLSALAIALPAQAKNKPDMLTIWATTSAGSTPAPTIEA